MSMINGKHLICAEAQHLFLVLPDCEFMMHGQSGGLVPEAEKSLTQVRTDEASATGGKMRFILLGQVVLGQIQIYFFSVKFVILKSCRVTLGLKGLL
jgi:hypothetical protein